MTTWLAIVIYRSRFDAEQPGSLDLQVQRHEAETEEAVRAAIEHSPPHEYENPYGETVTWELASIMAVDEDRPCASGDEVIGFIADASELVEMAHCAALDGDA